MGLTGNPRHRLNFWLNSLQIILDLRNRKIARFETLKTRQVSWSLKYLIWSLFASDPTDHYLHETTWFNFISTFRRGVSLPFRLRISQKLQQLKNRASELDAILNRLENSPNATHSKTKVSNLFPVIINISK